MNYIKVTYGIGNSFIKSTFEDNSTYVKTSVNSTFIKVAYDGGDAGLDAERLRTKVYNVTGDTLTKGTVVYINGSHGNLPSVAKAIATSDATSAQTLGLVLDDINDNKSGYIILAGKLSDLDTQAIPNGSQLYLSSTVAGAYTTTKQYAPAHLVYVGIVNRSHPTQGEIEVKIQNGYEADELHDFAVRNPSNNDGIFFNSSTSLWEKKQVSDALGYTPVPTSRTITINGVSYDLSADRSYTIAAGISGSGASGQMAYWSGSNTLTGSSSFNYTNGVIINSTISTDSAISLLRPSDSYKSLIYMSSNGSYSYSNNLWSFGLYNGGQNFTINNFNGFGVPIEYFRVSASTGNVMLYALTPDILDDGNNLQVYGSAMIQLSLKIGNQFIYDVSNETMTLGQNNSTFGSRIFFNYGANYGGDFTSKLNGVEQLSFGFSNTNGFGGGTSGTASGRTLYFYDRVNSVFFGGYSAINGFYFGQSSSRYGLRVENANVSVTGMTIKSGGNVLIGGTSDDGTNKLQVTGTMKVTAPSFYNTTFASTAQSVYNTYAPTGYSSWLIGVETNYFAVYSGRNIFYLNRSRSSGFSYLNSDYFRFGTADAATAQVDIEGSSTARASLRIRSGVAPTSPNDGDIWYDGTNIYMRVGTTTKTFTLV